MSNIRTPSAPIVSGKTVSVDHINEAATYKLYKVRFVASDSSTRTFTLPRIALRNDSVATPASISTEDIDTDDTEENDVEPVVDISVIQTPITPTIQDKVVSVKPINGALMYRLYKLRYILTNKTYKTFVLSDGSVLTTSDGREFMVLATN